MRIAAFNVENLFNRAKALNNETWAEGKPILEAYARLSKLFEKDPYSAADRKAMLKELDFLGLKNSDEGNYVWLRRSRGALLKRPRQGPAEVVAGGRGDWIGWLELKTEIVNETAIRNTARVIADVKADVLAFIEAENRPALTRFNDDVLSGENFAYESIMLIDGNDERGIDVGVMTRRKFEIESMRSHVGDKDADGDIFSRDCPEYFITTPGSETVLVLVNHLKSKGFGSQDSSDRKRKRQARRIRQIYDARRTEGVKNIAILGDFNDTPDSDSLAPLLKAGSDLKDVSLHPAFVDDGRPGTYKNGTKGTKIDYILLSPALFARVKEAAYHRTGVWGGKNGDLWPVYDTMERDIHAASDHAAIWADIDI